MQEQRSKSPTHDTSVSAVQSLLDSFARALVDGRGEDVARLWETPALVLGDDQVHAVATSQEIAAFFGGARGEYHARGITSTYAEIVRETWLTDRIVEVDVRWPHLDDANEEIGHEISTYVLRRDDQGGLRIRVAIMHGEGADR